MINSYSKEYLDEDSGSPYFLILKVQINFNNTNN